MATIEKRDKGWRARIRRQGLGTIDRHFLTKAEAVAWAANLEARYQNNELRSTTSEQFNLTLYSALLRYQKEVTPLKRGAPQERKRVAAWLNEPLSRERLVDISARQVAVYRDRRLGDGAAPNTVRLDLALLSHLFNVARREWGFEFIQNPVSIIRKPGATRGRERRIVNDEEPRLIEGARASGSPWLAPILIFAIETAMRQGEILSLRWEDIDLETRVARLRHTKNGDERRVPLSGSALSTLQDIRPKPAGIVFPYKADNVRLAFNRLRISLNIEDLRFHDLRHEATTRLFEKGLNQMEVSAITGHKTLQMLKRYTHLRAEDLVARLG